MCGRFILTSSPAEVAEQFDVGQVLEFSRKYNIAPTQDIVGVVKSPENPSRKTLMFRWGLVPSWSKEPTIGARLINARSETLTEKPAFRSSFNTRRTLIPANGFYEWAKKTKPHAPYLIGLKNDALFAMAGIWDEWQNCGNNFLRSCSIITTNANGLIKSIHERMPVIVKPENYSEWLETKTLDFAVASKIFEPFPEDQMEMRAVSLEVNKANHDGIDCIQPLDAGLFGGDPN